MKPNICCRIVKKKRFFSRKSFSLWKPISFMDLNKMIKKCQHEFRYFNWVPHFFSVHWPAATVCIRNSSIFCLKIQFWNVKCWSKNSYIVKSIWWASYFKIQGIWELFICPFTWQNLKRNETTYFKLLTSQFFVSVDHMVYHISTEIRGGVNLICLIFVLSVI